MFLTMKFFSRIRVLIAPFAGIALCSCSQWMQQTEGYFPLTPETWCSEDFTNEQNFPDVFSYYACRNLNGEKPYCDYVKRPLKLQCDMHVRYYQVTYNPDMRELYGDDFKQYLRFQGLWDQRDEEGWRKGARLPVVPRGSTVVVHCVKGFYQYAVDKRTGILKHPSSDVVALVEFLDPRTRRTVYGEYAWTSVEGIRKEDTFVLHRYLKRAPWESSRVPRLRAIQGAGYPIPET